MDNSDENISDEEFYREIINCLQCAANDQPSISANKPWVKLHASNYSVSFEKLLELKCKVKLIFFLSY